LSLSPFRILKTSSNSPTYKEWKAAKSEVPITVLLKILVLLRCDIMSLGEWFRTLGTTHPTAQHHIPEDINP
jgi:hypothetical protein